MSLSNEEKLKAIKISRALEEYLKMTGKTMMRSTEVYEYLARKGLVERDRHQGIYFRKFLNKIKREGALDLIPQCTAIDKDDIYTDWYFHSAGDKALKNVVIKQNEEKKVYGKEDALPVLKKIAAGLNPITGEEIRDYRFLSDNGIRKALLYAIDTIESNEEPVTISSSTKLKEASSSMTKVLDESINTNSLEETNSNFEKPQRIISEEELRVVKKLFLSNYLEPTSNRLVSFFSGTRRFTNKELISHRLYGKYYNMYSKGQMIDIIQNDGMFIFPRIIKKEKVVNPIEQVENDTAVKTIQDVELKVDSASIQSIIDPLIKRLIKETADTISRLTYVHPTETQSVFVKELRKKYPRAYEPWSDEEDEILIKLYEHVKDSKLLAMALLRKPSAINSRIDKHFPNN